MLCGGRSLVNEHDHGRVAITLRCRAWTCAYCRPERQRRLIQAAIEGEPNRFVTITVNPAIGSGPIDRAHRLAAAWRLVVKRMARNKSIGRIEFMAVFEKTKRGEPHLHILVRGKYIPQAWLSAQLKEIINSPICDVRKIDSPRKAANYIAKYVGKDPFKFGNCKRYWSTQHWRKVEPGAEEPEKWHGDKWVIDERPLWAIFEDWKREFRWPEQIEGEVVWSGIPPPWVTRMQRCQPAAGPRQAAARGVRSG